MILHGIEYQRPTSLNMRILADHVTYSFLAFMKSIFHFCLGCYCGGYSQNGRSNLSSCIQCKLWLYNQIQIRKYIGLQGCSFFKVIMIQNPVKFYGVGVCIRFSVWLNEAWWCICSSELYSHWFNQWHVVFWCYKTLPEPMPNYCQLDQ